MSLSRSRGARCIRRSALRIFLPVSPLARERIVAKQARECDETWTKDARSILETCRRDAEDGGVRADWTCGRQRCAPRDGPRELREHGFAEGRKVLSNREE